MTTKVVCAGSVWQLTFSISCVWLVCLSGHEAGLWEFSLIVDIWKLVASLSLFKHWGRKGHNTKSRELVVIPYLQGGSKPLQRIMKKFGISTAMKPHMTLRWLLVNPKDKISIDETCAVHVKKHIMGKLLGFLLQEKNIKMRWWRPAKFITPEPTVNLRVYLHKSASQIMSQWNHVMNWEECRVMGDNGITGTEEELVRPYI